MCEMSATCPLHARNDVKDPVTNSAPARAVTYHGDYAVVTMDNPAYLSPMSVLAPLLGTPVPDMFVHVVLKVGPEGCVGDLLEDGEVEEAIVFKQTFLKHNDNRLIGALEGEDPEGGDDSFNKLLTELMHESHDLMVGSVRGGVIG